MTLLIFVFIVKHFIADYLLQNTYMLGKFKDSGWIKPLAAHCGIHFLFTLFIAIFYVALPITLFLALLDFSIHFVVDRIKASKSYLGRFEALSKEGYVYCLHKKTELESLCAAVKDDQRIYRHRQTQLDSINRRFISNKLFWFSLGLDQMAHHLTDLFIVWYICQEALLCV